MKKILITGSHGFLGRNMSILLKKNFYKVYGIGNGKWSKKQYKKWGYDYLINGEVNLKNLLKNFNKVDYIVHCAGRVIGLSPYEDFLKNVLPTQAILEFIKLKKINPKIIYLSTIAVNETKGIKAIDENFLVKPNSNYALNKKISEDLLSFYSGKFKLDVLIARTTSLYGDGLKRQFIFDACKKISNKNNNFFGTGNEIRDWLHVSDMSRLILRFIKKGFKKKIIVNCGSGTGNRIKDVLKILMKELKVELEPQFNKVTDSNPAKLIEYVKWYKKKF